MALLGKIKKLGKLGAHPVDPVKHFKAGVSALGSDVVSVAKKAPGQVRRSAGFTGGPSFATLAAHGRVVVPSPGDLSSTQLAEHRRVVVPKPPTLREFQLSLATTAERQSLLGLSNVQRTAALKRLSPRLSQRASELRSAVRAIQTRSPGTSTRAAAGELRTIARERKSMFRLPPGTRERAQTRNVARGQRQEVRAAQGRRSAQQRQRRQTESRPPVSAPAPRTTPTATATAPRVTPPAVVTPERPRRRISLRSLF